MPDEVDEWEMILSDKSAHGGDATLEQQALETQISRQSIWDGLIKEREAI